MKNNNFPTICYALIFIIGIISSACSNLLYSQQDEIHLPRDIQSPHWLIEKLGPSDSLSIIEASGSYYEIGYFLGTWYLDKDFVPRPLSSKEIEEAKSLIAFYESVNSSINDQMRGIYDAYGLDFIDIQDGIQLSDQDNIEILLPGLINQHSCSVIFSRPEISPDNHARLGRNYDFPTKINDLTLMFTYPENGYPTAVITPRTPGLIAADGINSQGLALGFASVEDIGYAPPPGEALISSFAYRYILEHSANVTEAIVLLQTIPIKFVPTSPEGIITHLLIADQSGDSAVVEFLPEGVVINRIESPYQVMTNNIWGDQEIRKSCQRYLSAVNLLEKGKGSVNSKYMMTILAELRGSTQYSVVYDLHDLTLILGLQSDDFSEEYKFSLTDFMNQMKSKND